MAKRRKLEAPSADALNQLEEEFRRETSPRGPLGQGGAAPIAQVAADAAALSNANSPEARQLQAEAERLRKAEVPENQLARIHAPVGLDIGAENPAEIALSALAQITETLRHSG